MAKLNFLRIGSVRIVRSPGDAERFALKTTDVEEGDRVWVQDSNTFYRIIDTGNLDNENGYAEEGTGSLDAEGVRDALESLEGDDRLPASAISGLGDLGGGDVTQSGNNAFTGENSFTLSPAVDRIDLDGGTELVVGGNYHDSISANRTLTVSGSN